MMSSLDARLKLHNKAHRILLNTNVVQYILVQFFMSWIALFIESLYDLLLYLIDHDIPIDPI